MPYSAIYSATKFALRGFTFSLAEELKGTGTKISLITPGSVVTKMLDYEAKCENSAISFVSKPISPAKVADAVLRVIHKPGLGFAGRPFEEADLSPRASRIDRPAGEIPRDESGKGPILNGASAFPLF